MSKDLMITLLDKGATGAEILSILDSLCDGVDDSESCASGVPTLGEIKF